MKSFADVDIDVKSHTDRSKIGIKAIIFDENKQEIKKHPSGIYINNNIPIDYVTGYAAIDYKEAEDFGFIKVDILTNTSYDNFNSKEDVLNSLSKEPEWNKLLIEDYVKTLPHIGNHFDIVSYIKPNSIEDLADVLALIRPGKQHLTEKYKKNKIFVRKNLYRKPKSGFFFKRSHSFGYACMIVCVMNNQNKNNLIEF